MEAKKEEKNIAKYGEEELRNDWRVGMSRVDPADILPPSILIAQKSSDYSALVDKTGKTALFGQYFHTARFQIYDSFECYLLFAAKGKYVDKRHPEDGEQILYKVIGSMADDLSIFGMVFRKGATYCLSTLFGAAAGLKRPMFAIRIRLETKKLSNKDGEWVTPVIRILQEEPDSEKLGQLRELALGFDTKAAEIADREEEPPAGEEKENSPF